MNREADNLTSTHRTVSSLEQAPLDGLKGLLGVTHFGQSGKTPCIPDSLPAIHVSTPPLLEVPESLLECWSTSAQARAGKQGKLAFRHTENWLLGCLSVEEEQFQRSQQGEDQCTTPLQQASQYVYEEIFRLLAAQDFPYLYRVWNYLPDINDESQGMERYQQFNMGRQAGFAQFHRPMAGNVPSASALGSLDGPLSICFLAGRCPPTPIENPRQISAYHYPAAYGPKTPTFSRAVLVPMGSQRTLFISGTASIVGHQSLHPNDAIAQTRETLVNIAALVEEANRQEQDLRFNPTQLQYKVYVRHPEDLAGIRREINAWLGDAKPVLFLQADICRRELLVEIEASGSFRN